MTVAEPCGARRAVRRKAGGPTEAQPIAAIAVLPRSAISSSEIFDVRSEQPLLAKGIGDRPEAIAPCDLSTLARLKIGLECGAAAVTRADLPFERGAACSSPRSPTVEMPPGTIIL